LIATIAVQLASPRRQRVPADVGGVMRIFLSGDEFVYRSERCACQVRDEGLREHECDLMAVAKIIHQNTIYNDELNIIIL